jgi:SNF2 family DNA or RNA helicase
MTIEIELKNVGNQQYFLIENFQEVYDNPSLKLSLKRFKAFFKGNTVAIPLPYSEEVNMLQAVRELLSTYQINYSLSKDIKKLFARYELEMKQFEEFSENARLIRDNKYKEDSNLNSKFYEFKDILSHTLVRPLYPLQELSAFHMAFVQNSCNFSVPGAGKTSIVYGAYSYLKSLPKDNPKHVDNLLIIGPLSSFAPWENEFFECFGRSASVYRASGAVNNKRVSKEERTKYFYSSSPCEITLLFHGGVDTFKSDLLFFLKNNKTMVVVDEAHRIKNPFKKWGKGASEISKEAVSRVILTGTPVPNGYQDLFNLYKFIYPFKYKEILKFHYINLEELSKTNDSNNPEVLKLKENISPFFIRIKKDDLRLPPQTHTVIPVQMNLEQRIIYDFIFDYYYESFKTDSSATVGDVLNKAKLIRLRQAATNPSILAKPIKETIENEGLELDFDSNYIFDESNIVYTNNFDIYNMICNFSSSTIPNKFVEALEIVKGKIENKEKVIIWTIFIQNAKELKDFLLTCNIKSKLLIGEVELEERESVIEKFNNPDDNEFYVVIANPFSVSESISLHKGCHNAIYLERDYNCSNFLQSRDRIHRYGLKDQITNYYYLISDNSIDEVIESRLQAKITRMEELINDDIPLFNSIDDTDETEIVKDLVAQHDKAPL